MAHTVLNDVVIKNLKTTEVQEIFWDSILPNFGVRVSPKSKAFIVRYGTRRKTKTIGRYPNLSLKDARITAIGLLSEESTAETSLAQTRYLEAIEPFMRDVKKRLKPESWKQYERFLRNLAFNKALEDITKADINEALTFYEGKPWAQNYAYAVLRSFLNWCLDNEYVTTHPLMRGRPPNKTFSRERVLSDDEMARVWRYTQDNTYGRMVRVLLLTGQRRMEVRNLKPEDVSDGLITFHTKGDNINVLPLTPLVEENLILPYKFNNWSQSLGKLSAECRVDFRHHDLRRTMATKLAQLKVNDIVIERVLGHTVNNVKHTYNRYSYLDEVKEALLLYEAHIRKITGNQPN